MLKNSIEEGKRVTTIIDGNIITGVVKTVYPIINSVIIKADAGGLYKTSFDKIVVEEPKNKPEHEEEPMVNNPFDKPSDFDKEITITKSRLIETVARLATKKDIPTPVGLSFMIFGSQLIRALFNDADDSE